MLSGLGNWLERSDEDFLKDLYTDAGRRYKLENLRRARLRAWQGVIIRLALLAIVGLISLIGVVFFLEAVPFNNGLRLDLFLFLAFVVLALDLINRLVDFQRIDSQIKTLLLVAQLKTD